MSACNSHTGAGSTEEIKLSLEGVRKDNELNPLLHGLFLDHDIIF